MSEARLFTVRPLSKPTRSDHKDAFRVYLSASSLANLKLRVGDICSLTQPDGLAKTAIAWNATESIQNTVIQTSRTLQEFYGMKLGEKVYVHKIEGTLDAIETVYLTECSDGDRVSRYGSLSPSDLHHWAWALGYPLLRCEHLTVGLAFELELKGERRSFKVTALRSQNQNTDSTLLRFSEETKVSIGEDPEGGMDDRAPAICVKQGDLGGMSRQIEDINESLADFNSNSGRLVMPSFYEHSRGMLLYGPKGTGKTALLSQIQASGWKKTYNIGSSTFSRNTGDAEARLRKVFHEAARCQPSAIIIDQLEFLAPKRSSMEAQSLSSILCECLESVRGYLVLTVAATRHPNDVDDVLRTPHRLGTEIELQVPTAHDRAEILKAICGRSSPALSGTLIDMIAEKTHGYVGADLFALLQAVCRKARRRYAHNDGQTSPRCNLTMADDNELEDHGNLDDGPVSLRIQETDVMLALQETRPTAMREVFLETPKVRWTDIGGQHDIKRRLQKAVERPLKHPERMQRLNVNSKKGILLYGPPGCSKTLTVKALATEAGLNFLAVKGAEILSMYVGESERSLREIFRKARSARPSIIFFDEIDAIASKRSSTSQGGVNVLTTLLNEMDGIEELKSVLVIAATNKPDVIDPALMRPGRLDNILYIGPPDHEARKEILSIWCRKSVVNPEVALDELASKTAGYSGAEIVSICETAGEAALDEEEETGKEQDVGWRHFEIALKQVKRQITDDVVRGYQCWGESIDC
ncbi:AAA+-type ATPase [Aspergillus nanangensis]|uniref:AAA+-type ATPase n=1 Tax=Aspergillus nanangensis TaxID=2582783 RepID=A0AAD4CVC2_ASPNN|nr:AAA+-type ATPase [Aspergillus nanangensis]